MIVIAKKMSSSNYRKKSRRYDQDSGSRRRSRSADQPQVAVPGEVRNSVNLSSCESHGFQRIKTTPSSSKVSNSESGGDSNNEKLLVALRIRPLKNEERSRGYESVATKVDSKVSDTVLHIRHCTC